MTAPQSPDGVRLWQTAMVCFTVLALVTVISGFYALRELKEIQTLRYAQEHPETIAELMDRVAPRPCYVWAHNETTIWRDAVPCPGNTTEGASYWRETSQP